MRCGLDLGWQSFKSACLQVWGGGVREAEDPREEGTFPRANARRGSRAQGTDFHPKDLVRLPFRRGCETGGGSTRLSRKILPDSF